MLCNTGFQRSQRGNTATGLLQGLLIGRGDSGRGCSVYQLRAQAILSKSRKHSRHGSAQSLPAGQSEPIALPGKPGDQPVAKPKFDFYKILPGGESASAPVVDKPAEPVAEKIYLQAGAYQNPSDADNLKARLALMGIEASVQRVDLGTKGIFYRVRLGTFGTTDAAETMRARLATEGIEAGIVRSNP